MTLVDVIPLALKIRPKLAANVWPFVPLQFEPAQPFINRSRRFLGVARSIRVFDPKDKGAAMMSHEEPIEKRRARPANVQVPGRRRREANSDWGIHFSVILCESDGPRKC